MMSIGRRLGLSLSFSLLVAGLLVGQGSLWGLDQEQRRTMASHLHDEATSVLAALVASPAGLVLRGERLDPAYRAPLSGRYFVVETPNHHWRSRSLWEADLPVPERSGMDSELQDGPDGQQLLRYRANYVFGGVPVTVVVAQDYAPQLEDLEHIKAAGALAWLLTLAILVLVQQWLIRRGLRPLNQVRAQIGQLRDGHREQLDENVAPELRSLVSEVNRLQYHTDQQLRRSRNAVGDLGHALKTPLAVLRNCCDEALAQQDPALYHLLDDQLGQIETTVRRALNRARVAVGATALNRFEPEKDLPLLIDSLRRAHGRALKVTLRGLQLSPQPVDRDDMLEILGNLADNAFKWARERVWVTLGRQDNRLTLTVADDGPGIEADRREAVLRRGGRLDRRTPGHGLGLAIVSDTVEAYGGSLTLSECTEGGLRAMVMLPLPVPE